MIKKLVICSLLFILVSCNNDTSTNTDFKEYDYSDFKNIDADKIFLQESNSYGIYFYNENCNICETIKYEALNYIKIVNDSINNEIDTIYLLSATITNLNKIKYYKDINENGTISDYNDYIINVDNLNDFAWYAYPTLYIIKNKAISNCNLGGSSTLLYLKELIK